MNRTSAAKRWLALLTACFCCLALVVRANGAGPSLAEQAQQSDIVGQSEQNPFLIDSPALLAELATLVNSGATYGEGFSYAAAYYRQTADLDLSAYAAADGGAGWVPIGLDKAHPFRGHYDGGGFAVRNLTINRPADFQGLFGLTKNAVLQSVNIAACNIAANQCAGGLVGRADGATGTISACTVSGRITAQGSFAGGIVGVTDGVITKCASSASVAAAADAGGIVGYACFKVSGCRATGAVSAGSSVGGIAGRMLYGRIRECYFSGTSTASRASGSVGGIAGYLECAALTGSYSLGAVSASGAQCSVGGIVGSMAADSTVAGCYATGGATAGGSGYAGGIAGAMLGLGRQGGATVTPLIKGVNIIGCYATCSVNAGAGRAGGIVGLTEGSVTLQGCAALSSSVTGSGGAGRICGGGTPGATGNAAVKGCYAWSGMSVNGALVTDGQPTNGNGGALTRADGGFSPDLQTVFSSTPGPVWSFDGTLPRLEAAGGPQAALPQWLG